MKNTFIRPIIASATLLAACFSVAAFAQSKSAAEQWPSKTITMISPFAAGTTSDVIARIFGQGLSKVLNVPVIVENKVGASGNIGMAQFAKAAPDGYTLAMGTITTNAINQALFSKLPFALSDFYALGVVGITPNLLVVPANSSVKTVGDLVQMAKDKPGKLTFGSAGNGTTGQLAGELIKVRTGVDMLHAPYKDATRALTDLAGGEIDFMFYHPAAVMALIQGGRLRPIAVSSSTRSSAAPDVIPVDQQGISDFDLAAWWALYAPAGISPELKVRLRAVTQDVLADPQVVQTLIARGFESKPLRGDEIDVYLAKEADKWAEIVKRAGARVD
ncbi:PBP2_Bug_TTT domain containing protein [Burkholderiaceae bacterium]|jgi:tripartite-type tricarboxylate transporter receptor subunit TctC